MRRFDPAPSSHPSRIGRARGAAALLGLLAMLAGPAPAGAATPYRLGAQDHLLIKVWDIRNGDPYQWAALSGEFVVGADGAVSLPLVGEIAASGTTTAEFAERVGSALHSGVGLSTRPQASVQIVRYRPFYVLGAVQRPGRYEYQPGLTVLQAVSTAEGLVRASGSELGAVQRDAIGGRGDLAVLAGERIALLARQARLAAEAADLPAIDFPAELTGRAAVPLVAQTLQEERSLFAARRQSRQAQLEAIGRATTVLRSTLSALSDKDASLAHQLDLNRKDLSQVNTLVARGLTVTPRQLAAEQSVASFESSRLDIQLAALKAQQDVSQAERDVIELKARFTTDALSQAAEVRAKLAANERRAASALSLVQQAEAAAPGLSRPGVEPVPAYAIARAASGTSVPAHEGDTLEPGDVLRVSLPVQAPVEAAPPAGPALEAEGASR